MARKGELWLMAYKYEVQESFLQIGKYQKAMEDKDTFLVENGAKILKLEGDLLNKSEKLRITNNYYFELGQRASHFEHTAKESEEVVSSLRDKMISLFDLV